MPHAKITIKEVINKIQKKNYILPAIQREFVWNKKQICRLFDSIMQKYPIGSFLLWEVANEKKNNFQFYEFIRNFHERDNKHNQKASIYGDNDLIAILDGQQRLTALYLGLKGSYAEKIPRKRWFNDTAFPKKILYINLMRDSQESDMKYDFQFLTPKEASIQSEQERWFKVGKILDMGDLGDVFSYLVSHGLFENKKIHKRLSALFEGINFEENINYFMEKSQELDKVLNIFIRINSGGTILSYSDLLLSIATAQWEKLDAREQISAFNDEINKIPDGFKFSKDFILKTCLVLCNFPKIAFKVDNFNKNNMLTIEENWNKIKKTLRITINLIANLGYSFQTLSSNNSIIPIAYFIYTNDFSSSFLSSDLYKNDRKIIQKWLAIVLLKRMFSGQPDNVLLPMRTIIQQNPKYFPINEMIEHFRGTPKSLIFTNDEIDELLSNKYGQRFTFTILSLLYPSLDFRNHFHQDHIFPKSYFKKKKLRELGISEENIDIFRKICDKIGNLQLMSGKLNEEKSNKDFLSWLNNTFDNEQIIIYKNQNFIPNVDLSFSNFQNFIGEREKLIKEQFQKILDI
ncbi:DUF262 domain-containing protein [Promethearchaeum syntrophicum]|uniref:DUF262 domain-containing protein n=1 Tax=Promethearchaeum syntrophicum TaxID=2594042 RepID=A0A5B9DCI6_9ARCH|nr:DUF262 domain-containing protein [Candidatus Prometheoarchaeum syntrophicum]QEE16822.1 hypothetical protein DSAG12_02652 [Candidatus Prometheoarchaeum syntrophicum]